MHTAIVEKDDGFYHYSIIDAGGGICECKNKDREECERQITKQQGRAKENGEVVQFNNAETSRTIKPGLKQKRQKLVLDYLAIQDSSITELKTGTRISSPAIEKVVDSLMVQGVIKKESNKLVRGRMRIVYSLNN